MIDNPNRFFNYGSFFAHPPTLQNNAETVSSTVIGAATQSVPPAAKEKSPTLIEIPVSTTAPLLPDTTPLPPVLTTARRQVAETTDVSMIDRNESLSETKSKFADIQKVYSGCENFPVDLSNYDDSINVKGRLNLPKSIQFFQSIGASDFVLNTLKNGHHPTLTGPVPQYEIPNHGSCTKHLDFALNDLENLIAKGRVEIVEKKPFLINPLHVVVQRLKKRLILDCSTLNKYIKVPKIKYENHEIALQYFRKGCFMYNYDLRDGYHHLSIHPDFRDYLGFKFVRNGKMTYGRYAVGCFGLSDLPWIYTKIY